jgi:hypothetical protein
MQVIVQVVTDRDDRFVLAEEERLRELAALTPGTPALKEERTRAFWALTTPTAVRNTNEVDYVLVLDGIENENSWSELLDRLESWPL